MVGRGLHQFRFAKKEELKKNGPPWAHLFGRMPRGQEANRMVEMIETVANNYLSKYYIDVFKYYQIDIIKIL